LNLERMNHYDSLETRDPAEREAALLAALGEQVENARRRAPAFAEILKHVGAARVTTREELAKLPVLRKSELTDLQRRHPPFGGFATVAPGETSHIFASPGPIYELAGRRPDYGQFARALFAAGFRRGDVIYNTFSYHFTPAGIMVDNGARELGCAVFPAGVGQTELQAATMADLKPQGYVGTPSFLKILLEKGHESGADLSSVRKALVSGEALPASLRSQFADRGVAVRQCYTTADLGTIAYESEAMEGLIVSEGLLVEIVRPGTGDPVPKGEVGEVVVTNTLTPEYSLLRFATGDLSAFLPGQSSCGRTNRRIRGWLGRADQSAKVRGMFVHPSLVAQVVRRHPEIQKARLVIARVDDADVMTLRCETASPADNLRAAVVESIREVCKLRGEVDFVVPGTLPNDGKVVDDTRKLE
jgi:phenylacetate-coenzyme A ligase PaaK-like adenylate-forming protein